MFPENGIIGKSPGGMPRKGKLPETRLCRHFIDG